MNTLCLKKKDIFKILSCNIFMGIIINDIFIQYPI